MLKVNDFGEKIGGARKDFWKNGYLSDEDVRIMNDAEKSHYITKENVWKKQKKTGMTDFVYYWQNEVRKHIPCGPYRFTDLEEECIRYVRALNEVKDATLSCSSLEDIAIFYETSFSDTKYIPGSIFSLKYSHVRMERKMTEKCERKVPSKRKEKFKFKALEHIERGGVNYRNGIQVDPDIWQREFAFRGVEFGNWLSQKDRRESMNHCYDALRDLALVLRVDTKDITFSGSLALGFGSRGKGGASAHYEILREVINLTKLNGAGCTAHEWMHALDHKLAIEYGVTNGQLASQLSNHSRLPKSFSILVKSLQYDAEDKTTDFYKSSRRMDKLYAKDAHGYWSSNPEMLARAFGCYIKDTLNVKSDYLIAHADAYEFRYDNQGYSAVPQGEERELLNELFDNFFYELKKTGFFHEPKKKEMRVFMYSETENYDVELKVLPNGQLTLF